jgi:hypothetical protein
MTTIDYKNRAWIRLPSGGRLDLINPSPDAWKDSDLACRLSRTYRWGGESCWPFPLSVGQHSLAVLALREERAPEPLTALQKMYEIMHDAEECFIGFDCISPLKRALGKPFEDISNRIMDAIMIRYGLPELQPEEYKLHKEADLIAAASEAVHCIGWSEDEVRNLLGITHPILEVDPLVAIYDCTPWEPWAPKVAAERFMAKLEELTLEVARESRPPMRP